MAINYQWDRAEFLEIRRNFGYQKPLRILVAVAVAAFFLASIVGTSNRVSYLIGGLALTYSICYSWMMPVFLWKKSKSISEPLRVIANNEGILLTTSTATTEKPWSELRYSTEYSDYFRLKKSLAEIYLTIPKRGFESAIDVERFRSLLNSHTTLKWKTRTLL